MEALGNQSTVGPAATRSTGDRIAQQRVGKVQRLARYQLRIVSRLAIGGCLSTEALG